MRSLIAVVALILCGSNALAQAGTLSGTVARDSSGDMVGQAEVRLSQLGRSATTNWLGEFRFSDVPPGRYAIAVRAVGFQPLVDSITIEPGAPLDADIILTESPVQLAGTKTTAAAAMHLPPGLDEMAERMNRHMGGYFVTDSVLRANDTEKLTYFFAHIPGVHEVLGTTNHVYLANHRDPSNNGTGVFSPRPVLSDGSYPANQCYVDVYLDGARFWVGPPSPGNPPPDIAALWASGFSGIE